MADLTTPNRPKSRHAAPSRVPEWEPSRNSIHRLIQLMDVIAIAFNKYRQLSFGIPRHGTPEYSPEIRIEWLNRLGADYMAVHKCVFPSADTAPQFTARRLADDAIAEAVNLGISGAESPICEACDWMRNIGWVLTPKTGEFYHDEWGKRYEAQGELLHAYFPCRERLISMLAPAGYRVPIDINRRFKDATGTHLSCDDPPKSVEILQLMVTEATQEDSSETARCGHAALVADVTLGELELRLVEWERAKEAPRPGGVRVSSVTGYLNRGYASAIAGQRVAELHTAAECVPGFSELHTLSIRLFRDDLNSGTCKMFRHALVDDGMNGAEASGATIADVLARLHAVQGGVSGGSVAKTIRPGKRRPGRREAKDGNPERYKADLKFYQDWQSSGLTQAEFLRERGIDGEEGVKTLGRGKHHARKSGNNSSP